jgi:Protein of unknown function (DUF4231)
MMKQDEFEKYKKERYEDQVDWYDRKSQKFKKLYLFFQAPVIILALIVPVVVVLEGSSTKWIAVVISALVAIGTSLLKTFKYQETWINYRTTCETLKKEIYYYDWKLGEYQSVKNPMQLFVERVESLLSQENTMWLSAHSPKTNQETSGAQGGESTG